METLDATEWDVIISGTGLPQSLLALSLSRSGKRILHVDENDYYGGSEAAFSLDEAEAWAATHASTSTTDTTTSISRATFSHASITRPTKTDADNDATQARLSPSRAYCLTLSPHLLLARSRLIDTIVSSQLHNQLDFQAVGSFFVLNPTPAPFSLTRLVRVPSAREDVFADERMDLKAKRSLMKFLRFVQGYNADGGSEGAEGTSAGTSGLVEEEMGMPFEIFLERRFGIPAASRGPILALTLAQAPSAETRTDDALRRIQRYLTSLGVFGPGFGAVLPKWGGLSEIVQVACRACAVGGGVYVLGKAVQNVHPSDDEGGIEVLLDGGEKVKATYLVGAQGDLPNHLLPEPDKKVEDNVVTTRSISVISSPLSSLFPQTSEGGPIPAGAVIMVPAKDDSEPPVYIFAHTSEAGECPMGQCILYASTALSATPGFERLDDAVKGLLENVIPATPSSDASSTTEATPAKAAKVLWKLQYQQLSPHISTTPRVAEASGKIIALPAMPSDLVSDDGVLKSVRDVWRRIVGDGVSNDDRFLVFDARDGGGMDMGDDDE